MARRYGESAKFFNVYIREAHPTDGWVTPDNVRAGIEIAQPKTFAERLAAAQQCNAALHSTMPTLVDTIDNRVGRAYSAFPDRIYVIDREGRIVYKGGRGPFGFLPLEMEQSLILLLAEEELNGLDKGATKGDAGR